MVKTKTKLKPKWLKRNKLKIKQIRILNKINVIISSVYKLDNWGVIKEVSRKERNIEEDRLTSEAGGIFELIYNRRLGESILHVKIFERKDRLNNTCDQSLERLKSWTEE